MPRIIEKSGYMKKSEHRESYTKYIATRDGVEINTSTNGIFYQDLMQFYTELTVTKYETMGTILLITILNEIKTQSKKQI